MSAIYTLSNELVDIKRKETIDSQSIRKTVNFSEINLIDSKSVEYKGQRLSITEGAVSDIIKLAGLPSTFVSKLGQLFSEEAKLQFINRIKDAMATNIGRLNEVTLIVNPNSRQIIAVKKADTNNISNERFLDVVDRIIDQNSLEVTNWTVNPNNGRVNINAFNPKAIFDVKGLKNETFTGGISFSNSPNGGFEVMPYVNRLFCTNGLTTTLAEETYTLNSLDNTTMSKFFEHLTHLRRNNFAPAEFGNMVREANNTPASMLEMSRAFGDIHGLIGERAENWIPFKENMNNYNKAGIELDSAARMSKAKSNQSVWSLVNALTYAGTHGRSQVESNKFNDYDSTHLMMRGGSLLGGKWDFANQVPDIYGASALQEHFQVGASLN